MKAQTVNTFNENLLIAFAKMIKGINVELSEEGRNYWCKDDDGDKTTGRWFFITAINQDESVSLCSNNHYIFENATLSHIKL